MTMTRVVPAPRRGRGTWAGLDLARIVEAARRLDPRKITMQALADELGVDRKALNHHVGDRETLLALAALDAFAENFGNVRIGEAEDWRQACRHYARAFVRSMIATGLLVEHFRLRDSFAIGILQPSEELIAKLVASGFDDNQAGRILALLATICLGHARDTVMASQAGQHPRKALIQQALKAREPGQLQNLARLAASNLNPYDDTQFDLSIEIFVRGIEDVLRDTGGC